MAMISLSAASRLRPSRIPTRTDIGMVTQNRFGSVNRNTSKTLLKLELFRTTISRI